MVSMPHIAQLVWNYTEQLKSTDLGGGGIVYYCYDSSGNRSRKVYEHSGIVEDRIYLGGYEIYRKTVGTTLSLERETLHVSDGAKRILLFETKTVDVALPSGLPQIRPRWQLDNHLGSSSTELNGSGQVISYEEYHPFGSTSFHTVDTGAEVSAKRYRYTGKERDDETGLYYYGARYYASWLGRWLSCDPSTKDGEDLYVFVRNNPVRFTDRDGRQSGEEMAFRAFWRQLNAEVQAYVETAIGGHANVSLQENKLDYTGWKSGVGGLPGGAIRAATLRAVPMEQDATIYSRAGMEAGAATVPFLGSGADLITGKTVAGNVADKKQAALSLGLDAVTFGYPAFRTAMPEFKAGIDFYRLNLDAAKAEVVEGLRLGTSPAYLNGPQIKCSLRANPSSYYKYNELSNLISKAELSGRNAGLEAHHLLEKQYAANFGVKESEILSVPLTPKWHRGSGGEKIISEGENINNAIEKELKTITGAKTQRGAANIASTEQIWQAHRNVYESMGHADWANAIYDAYVKKLDIPYKR
jgi:RHS repeat-associated protein